MQTLRKHRLCAWIVASLLLSGCGRSSVRPQGALQIKGSDTMVNLVQAWAEAFMQQQPTVLVSVTGGGSGTGIASLLNGTTDIASASRPMSASEREQARAQGWTPQEMTVALDGLAVVVHPNNPVSRLTVDQLADMFTGTIANWRDVGGSDAPIVLLSREVNSGTHVYFKEHVLRHGDAKGVAEYAPAALLLPSSQAIADEVAHNAQAIGYYGMGYLSPKQKALAVAKDARSLFVAPVIAAVRDGSYPIARPLFFYTRDATAGARQQFIDFVLSPEGQRVVSEQDFVPVH